MVLLVLFVILTAGSSIDLGTYGPTYPVKETPPHLLIQERLKGFRMPPKKIMMKDIDLPKAEENKKRLLDPTYTVESDIKDSKGNIIVKRGTRVNPQEKNPLKRRYLFINPDNPDEIEIAKKVEKDVVIEIIRGNPDEIRKIVKRPIFRADEIMVKRFGIKVTPSFVRGNGEYLEITEFVPGTSTSR